MLTVTPEVDPSADRRRATLSAISVEARPAGDHARGRGGSALRVVTDADRREVQRRVRVRRMTFAFGAVVAVLVFGVVVAHVLLMQGQFQLQELEGRATAAQSEFDRLRLEVSELESPERIVATAQDRLGMVAPEKVTYLAPSTDPAAMPVVHEATAFATGKSSVQSSQSSPASSGGAPASWTTVKSQLAGG